MCSTELMLAYKCNDSIQRSPPYFQCNNKTIVFPGYDCRAEYVPPPGYKTSYLLGMQIWMRDAVLSSLPREWSKWICYNVSGPC